MKQKITVLIAGALLLLFSTEGESQNARDMVRKGNKLYENEKYTEAEVQYLKSLDNDPNMFEAKFNLADAMIRQKKYEQAIEQLQILAAATKDKKQLASVYHNMGNAFLASQQLQRGLEAYKMALRNNPNDDETRYNLAFAQHQLQKQQDQQQQQNGDENIPPLTEEAKKIKAECDKLLSQGKFRDALQLMQDAAKKDPSIANYKDYIGRLSKVCGIEN